MAYAVSVCVWLSLLLLSFHASLSPAQNPPSSPTLSLDVAGNVVVAARAGRNVSIVGGAVSVNGLDVVQLFVQVQTMAATQEQMRQALMALNASHVQQQATIAQQQQLIVSQNASLFLLTSNVSSLSSLVSQQQTTIAQQQQLIATQNASLALLTSNVSSLSSFVSQQQATITQQQQLIATQNASLSLLTSNVSSVSSLVSQQQATITQQQQLIASQNTSLSLLTTNVSSLSSLVSQQSLTISQQQQLIAAQNISTQALLASHNASLAALQATVAAQQQTIATLQLSLTALTGTPLLNVSPPANTTSSLNASHSLSSTPSIPGLQAQIVQLNGSLAGLARTVDGVAQNVGTLSTATASALSARGSGAAQGALLSDPMVCWLMRAALATVPFVSFPTSYAFDWESFTVGNTTYLAVAVNNNYGNSTIYRFDPSQPVGSQLVLVQQIPTSGARDWESFTIGNTTYLAVANYYNGNSYNTNSAIYRFDPSQPVGSQFVLVQQIPTSAAYDWESFTIGTTTYLAVANHYNGNSYNTNSAIYRFDPSQPVRSQFVLVQQIPTSGADDWESFTVGNTTYLAVANEYSNSAIYRFDPSQPVGSQFVLAQQIVLGTAYDLEAISIGTTTLLAVATTSGSSPLYRFDPSQPVGSQLALPLQMPTSSSLWDLESFTIGTTTYLAGAGSSLSVIYALTTSCWV